MKLYYLLIILLWSISYSYAQKKIIDASSYKNWPSINGTMISNDGRYVTYIIRKGVLPGNESMVIQSTKNSWKKEILGGLIGNFGFTSDSKYAIFIDKNGSLNIVDLKSKITKILKDITSFQINQVLGDWLIYELKDQYKTHVLYNLRTGYKRSYQNVIMCYFSGDQKFVMIKAQVPNKSTGEELKLVPLNTGKEIPVWEGNSIGVIISDKISSKIAFSSKNSVWYFANNGTKSVCLGNSVELSLGSELILDQICKFSEDGKRLFIKLKKRAKDKPIRDPNAVEIWSYKDTKLQSQENSVDQSYTAVIDLVNHKIIRLENENEQLGFSDVYGSSDTLATILKCPYDNAESNWNPIFKNKIELISTKTGMRTPLKEEIGSCLSPKGKYIIFFNSRQQNYFSYEVSSGVIRNMTVGLNVSWKGMIKDDYSSKASGERGIGAWLKDDKAVLIYDRNDIWKLDPLGIATPINLTNGYGLKHQIVFYLGLSQYLNNVISPKEKLILNAFNVADKNNGFYEKRVDRMGDPELLSMGPYIFQLINDSYNFGNSGCYPVEAKDANVYLVQRMSATEFPNYFITTDFKNFKRLTDIHPEKQYNWYTTELRNWLSLDGRKLQGILYKPEDFDPNKKYPIIFYYYERLSDNLNEYLKLKPFEGQIDIPTYVSNGYLVFTPDIFYKERDPMQGTHDAIVSAAEYISKLSFVDAKKMGLQGHSFGGIQTNYLVTSTSLFAAACSASSVSDWISAYGTVIRSGFNGAMMYETGQNRMGTSLWENLAGYMKNSPILYADKVTTPLLMEHGKKDVICPFPNALEFFLGLRRLGKKAWMLVYPEGGHSLFDKDAEDFEIRMMQFFDHYLKDKPAPVWMLEDNTVKSGNIRAGLELDSNGRTPGPGILKSEEQKKVDSLMTRTPITITLR